MSDVNIPELVATMLGPSERIYRQDLTKTAHLEIDKLGAGDFEFDDGFHPPSSRSEHVFKHRGLFVATHRPKHVEPIPPPNGPAITSTIAGVRVPDPATPLLKNFVVAATFRAPKYSPNNNGFVRGEWAPVIVIFRSDPPTRDFFAATAQFRTPPPIDRVRLNLPQTGAGINRPDLAHARFDEIMRAENPLPFTLVLHVNRTPTGSTGDALMFIGAENMYPPPELPPSFTFSNDNNLTSATVLRTIGAGIATGSGSRFKVSTEILEFEIWAPRVP